MKNYIMLIMLFNIGCKENDMKNDNIEKLHFEINEENRPKNLPDSFEEITNDFKSKNRFPSIIEINKDSTLLVPDTFSQVEKVTKKNIKTVQFEGFKKKKRSL